jgi:hypothetical protein
MAEGLLLFDQGGTDMKKILMVLAAIGMVAQYYPVTSSFSVVWVDDSYPDGNEDVDGDPYFLTVSGALDAVQEGGTINVAPGTYDGKITLDKDGITLQSTEGPSVTVVDYTGIWCGYWSTGDGGVDIPYGTKGVTVSGFTVLGGSPASDALISVGGCGNTVTGCVVVGDPSSGGQDIGIHIGNVQEPGVLPAGNMILNNSVYNHAGSGIFVGNWAGATNIISGNSVHDTVVGGIPGLNGNGIEVDRALGVTVINNRVFNNEAAGVKVVRTAPDAVIDIRLNSLFNNGNGILSEKWRPGAAQSAEVTISCNNIFGNTTFGVLNSVESLLEAETNWWGDSTGPYHPLSNPGGKGDHVSDNVTFTPWGMISDPCAQPSQSGRELPVGMDMCPLASYHIEEAEALLATVEGLLDQLKALDMDTQETESLLEEAEALLERAKTFCRESQNCIAGNILALQSLDLLEEAEELLTNILA